MPKVSRLILLVFGSIALVSTSALAQTYVYTYTGNDFTSVFNAANELFYGIVPYSTSSKVTGSIALSAPLGANYSGNPSATLLSFNFTDGVGPQNIGGGPVVPAYDSIILGTDSSGAIVSWNIQLVAFNALPESKEIQTENDSSKVLDSGSLDQPSENVGNGYVSGSPGMWVETIVPEPSVLGLLAVSTAAFFVRRRH